MTRFPVVFGLVLGLALANSPAAARGLDVTDPDLPRSLPASGPVHVEWTDPAQFSDIRQSSNPSAARRGDWVRGIASYLQKRAATRIPSGDTLDITITDIRRAGDYEPWRGFSSSDTRFIRDLYPPRIELTFRQTGRDGQVVDEGERKLTDLGFLMSASTIGDTDALRFEKRLVDDWLRKEFEPVSGS